ncbi:MAG: nucleotidyltransferase domain-containing protein [Candidatus Hydrothermarchaeota archaeon]
MDKNIKKFVEVALKIIGEENILSIILFGSRARGDYDKWSDYDFFLITNERMPEELEFKILYELDFPANIISRTPFEIKKAIELLNSLEIYAIFDGNVIYGKDIEEYKNLIKEMIKEKKIKMRSELGKGVLELGT